MKRLNFLAPKWKVMFTLAVFLFAVVSAATAQGNESSEELDETLKKLSEDAATQYVLPVVSAFGSNLNGGWFHKAPPAKLFSLDLEVGFVGMGTFFPDDLEYKHFSTSGDFRFNSEQAMDLINNWGNLANLSSSDKRALATYMSNRDFPVNISGATIIGESDDYIIIMLSETELYFPDPNNPGENIKIGGEITLPVAGFGEFLAEISFLPFAAPQIGVGTILGTRAAFRYIPEISMPGIEVTEDIGKFSWFGWGVQHNPGVFFPTPLPLDISVGFFKQTLKVGSVFEANTTAYGLNVSKRLGVGPIGITPYAGYMIEKSTMRFTYDFTVDQQIIPVDFELEGENKNRITVGLSLRLLMFNVNADYNFGNYNSVTVGIMFAL